MTHRLTDVQIHTLAAFGLVRSVFESRREINRQVPVSLLSFTAPAKGAVFPSAFKTGTTVVASRRAVRDHPMMEAQAAQKIVEEMNAHMTQSGIPLDRWYVGVSGDWQKRLFGTHRVPQQYQWFICRYARNHHDAEAIALAYHKAGSAGRTGAGEAGAVYVYAYAITPQTIQ